MLIERERPLRARLTALRARLTALCVTSAVALLLLHGGWLRADPPNPAALQPIAHLELEDIRESSGLAASPTHPGVFWTHNDSGDLPRLFAFDERGRHRGTSHWRHALAVDWESMGSFRLGNKAYLFVADVGDNLRRRSSVSIYLAEEPTSATQDVEASGIEFQFEGGPRDCEAVAFDPTSKSFLLIEKKLGLASDVFELPLKADPNVPRPALRTARRAGSIPVPLVTGVDISPDARLLAVTTYTSIVLYRRMDRESWMEAVKRGGKGIAVPPRRQGEAICFGSDGASLYLTSEKRPCPLFRISLEASAKDGE